jgi:hypothetical protein
LVKSFLDTYHWKENAKDFKMKCVITHRQCSYIKKVFMSKVRTADAKIEVLENYWDKLAFSLKAMAIYNDDYPMMSVARKI